MSELALFEHEQNEQSAKTLNAAVLTHQPMSDPTVSASVSTLQAKFANIGQSETDLDDRRAVRKSFAQSEAFIVVNPEFSKTAKLGRLARLSLRARLAGKPFALVGLSVSNLSTRRSRFLARFVVTHADLVLLRDEASADALIDAGVEPPFRIGADPAWAQLDELYAAREPADQMVVAIDLTDGDSKTSESRASRLEETLGKTLGPLADSGVEIILQPWETPDYGVGNELLAKKVSARLGGRATVVESPATLREARELYSSSRMVVATRRHALMAAAVAGSRAVSLSDSDDVHRFSAQLDVPTFSSESEPAAMSAALFDALGSEPATPAVVREQIDRAKGSLSLVRLLLTEGVGHEAASLDSLPLYPNPWRS